MKGLAYHIWSGSPISLMPGDVVLDIDEVDWQAVGIIVPPKPEEVSHLKVVDSARALRIHLFEGEVLRVPVKVTRQAWLLVDSVERDSDVSLVDFANNVGERSLWSKNRVHFVRDSSYRYPRGFNFDRYPLTDSDGRQVRVCVRCWLYGHSYDTSPDGVCKPSVWSLRSSYSHTRRSAMLP